MIAVSVNIESNIKMKVFFIVRILTVETNYVRCAYAIGKTPISFSLLEGGSVMSAFEQRKKRLYLFIVFGFAWGLLAITLAAPHVPGFYLAGFIAIAPLLAAYPLQITNYDQSFLAHVFVLSRPNNWWIVAVLVPFLFSFILLSTYSLTAHPLVFNPFVWVIVFAVALFQEIGWRGFLQRELSRLLFWKSSLVIGIISACWHIPIALILFDTSDTLLMMLVVYFVLAAAPLAFIVGATKSVFPSTFMQTGLFILLLLTTGYYQAVVVFFALLIMLNGVVMLLNAVFPSKFTNTFKLK